MGTETMVIQYKTLTEKLNIKNILKTVTILEQKMNICFASSFRRFYLAVNSFGKLAKTFEEDFYPRWLKESQYTIYLAISCFLTELILEISTKSYNPI